MGRALKEVVIIVVAIIATIYLINPTFGYIELIPDNFPIIGNLDEAGAVTILISTLGYYGIDMSKLYGRKKPVKRIRRITTTVDGEEIEEIEEVVS